MATARSIGLLACVVLGGCSGRYEVGEATAGTGGQESSSAGNPPATGSSGSLGGALSAGGSGPTGDPGDPLGSVCAPVGKPPAVKGPFVEPSVVWSRLTLLIHGETAPPPATLPKATTYAWAGDVVTQGFGALDGPSGGARLFAQEWLFPSLEGANAAPELSHDWGEALSGGAPALEVLLTSSLGGHRYGIFSERSFLTHKPSISERGATLSARLLSVLAPPHPEGIFPPPGPPPPPNVTRRQALASAVSALPCMGCHALIDPIGFALESFDELGEYRELDHGLPVDTSGTFRTVQGEFSFVGPLELGQKIAATCEGHTSLVDGFITAAMRINRVDSSLQEPLFEAHRDRVRQAFLRSEGKAYIDLVRAYAQSPLVLKP